MTNRCTCTSIPTYVLQEAHLTSDYIANIERAMAKMYFTVQFYFTPHNDYAFDPSVSQSVSPFFKHNSSENSQIDLHGQICIILCKLCKTVLTCIHMREKLFGYVFDSERPNDTQM